MLVSGGEKARAKRYSTLYRQNSFASCFYVLLQGTVRLEHDPGLTVGEGGVGGGGVGGESGRSSPTGGPSAQTLVVKREDRAGVVFGIEALHADVKEQRAATYAPEPHTLPCVLRFLVHADCGEV